MIHTTQFVIITKFTFFLNLIWVNEEVTIIIRILLFLSVIIIYEKVNNNFLFV